MHELRREEDALETANRHIAEGEARITRLRQLSDQERAAGIDPERCDNLIRIIESILVTFLAHRELILQEIDRLRTQDVIAVRSLSIPPSLK
jgi:hypothetical protein